MTVGHPCFSISRICPAAGRPDLVDRGDGSGAGQGACSGRAGAVNLMTSCARCANTRWVCEAHPDRPWMAAVVLLWRL
jgi:hypothetical protein